MTLLGGLKVPLSEAISNNDLATACSTTASDPGDPAADPVVPPTPAGALAVENNLVLSGNYVESIVAAVDGTTCDLTANFRDTGVSDKLTNRNIRFNYNPANGAWTCTSDITAGGIRPKTCGTPL